MTEYETESIKLEERRVATEERMLAMEERKLQLEQRFFHRHLGALITATVSIAAVLVSASQIIVASINKDKELELSHRQNSIEFEQSKIDNERRWKLDALTFVAENRPLIFSDDLDERRRIRDVMLATLPDDITSPLFLKLAALSPPEERGIWTKEQQASIESAIDSLKMKMEWRAEFKDANHLYLEYAKMLPQGLDPQYVKIKITSVDFVSDGKQKRLKVNLGWNMAIHSRGPRGGSILIDNAKNQILEEARFIEPTSEPELNSVEILVISQFEDGNILPVEKIKIYLN